MEVEKMKVPEKLLKGFRYLLQGVIETKIDARTSFNYTLVIDGKPYFVELSITPEEVTPKQS